MRPGNPKTPDRSGVFECSPSRGVLDSFRKAVEGLARDGCTTVGMVVLIAVFAETLEANGTDVATDAHDTSVCHCAGVGKIGGNLFLSSLQDSRRT